MEDLETLFCNSNDFNVPNINKDFPYGSPEENILFFKDVTPPEARNVTKLRVMGLIIETFSSKSCLRFSNEYKQ